MSQPKDRSIWDNFTNTKLIRYVLLFVLGWAIVQVFTYFSGVIIIFLFAAIIAFLLNIPVRWVSRIMPRGLAVISVFLLSLLLLVGIVATLGSAAFSQTQQLVEQAPQLLNSASEFLDRFREFLQRRNVNIDITQLQTQLRTQIPYTLGMGFATLQGVLLNLVDLIIIAVVALFMLLDGKRLWDLLLRIFPVEMRDRVTETVRKSLLGFFWGRFLMCIFFGFSIYIVFVLLGIPSALGLATIVSLFDLIPGVGATLGVSLVSLIVLPQGVGTALTVLVSCILLQQVQENLLMPRIMQGSIDLNPVVMFLALLVGAKVGGLVGIFLSIPIAGILISLFEIREMQGKHD
ncbi:MULTISPECIES: AI-2E family transporter [unclassified Chamaesiphon]|uniref:AI-2E family transporter n=1 Tax=unclassified Chamaesiphon TaxID=2620921 RepID=UPI00286B1FBB|nr:MULTISPECIES: AI-2E family transporter [unclassified Chamaesiphon]